MYLHSVNWLHKGFRSDSIIFFPDPEKTGQLDYAAPILSGFNYARPDLPSEFTERPAGVDLYRHPDLTKDLCTRSKKSHDIYSLGIVLLEIAYWQPIDKILNLDLTQKVARSKVRDIRSILLSPTESFLDAAEEKAGEIYREVVWKCLSGGPAVGTDDDADEKNEIIGAEMQRVFSEDIVGQLGGVKV
jgi:serine/threonine protein kinase